MDVLPWVFSSGWASGINGYAVVLILGRLGRFANVDGDPTGDRRRSRGAAGGRDRQSEPGRRRRDRRADRTGGPDPKGAADQARPQTIPRGGKTDAEIAALAGQLIAQRGGTAEGSSTRWRGKAARRPGCGRQEAVHTLWILMDPAVFERLVRHLHGTVDQYQAWLARSIRRLLIADSLTEPHEGGRHREQH